MSPGDILLAGAIGALSLLTLAWCVITGVVVVTVLALSPPGPVLEAADPEMDGEALDRIAREDAWAAGRGFEWVGAFEVNGQVTMAVWQRGCATFFVVYLAHGEVAREIVTVLGETDGLTTTGERSAMTLPRPAGALLEVFPGVDADGLLGRHDAGLEHLGRAGRLLARQRVDFEEVFLLAVHRQMAHVRSHRMWPARCGLWYVRGMTAPVGRPVSDQVDVHELRRAA